jgi:hypothetical protein
LALAQLQEQLADKEVQLAAAKKLLADVAAQISAF